MKCGACDGVELDIGNMDKPIKFQSPIVNAAGEQTGNWKDEGRGWASINGLSGRELFLAMQVAPRVTHMIETRWKSGLQTDWRILFGTRVFHIDRAINLREQNIKHELLCVENPQPTV